MSECSVILVKTELGMERYVANSLDVDCEIVAAPMGFKGLVLMKNCKNLEEVIERLNGMPEVIRFMIAEECVRADLKELKEAAKRLARKLEGKRFAVRTIRRGSHPFTSIEVNAELGALILREANGSKVDLTNPEAVLMVEIIGEEAYLAVVDPSYAGLKKKLGKEDTARFLSRLSVIQEPYLGPPKSIEELGKRIGRILQSYGVGEYYIGLIEETDALQLAQFIESVRDGMEARRKQEEKVEGKALSTKLKVFDVYHLALSKSKKELMVVFEPEGKSFEEVEEELAKALRKAKRVKAFLGSRKGVPMGIYKLADFVIDVAPGRTLSTETALAAALEALLIAYLRGKFYSDNQQ
ncbi:THUMP domain-containing protein [Ignicoccus islandicus DSM 13165]|uniref:THUMP domain-containing protein n=1 Tax=Ignicoccus islandicus DSM 13165 TaxID=940295 RepID=A0A0U2U5L3_9CREN|nr:SPOUT family RNA methylase [Ignicoccus islandicus]ALU11460.1 THUMP domain-containing protein [Ignicoccus islandicus DSM 13165]